MLSQFLMEENAAEGLKKKYSKHVLELMTPILGSLSLVWCN